MLFQQGTDAFPEALLLEEATSLANAPVHVQHLVQSLGANPGPADLTVALAVVVLVQSGFRTSPADAQSSTRTFDARVLRRLALPPGWVQAGRSSLCELPLWLSGRPDAECRLVAFLSQDTLLLTLVVLPNGAFSIALPTDNCWATLGLLCERTYKLALQARAYLQHDSTEVVPSLVGIPDELVLAILAKLGAKDLCRVSCVCRSLNAIAGDPALWKKLLRSDFPKAPEPEDGDYKKAYAQEEKARIERNRVRFLGHPSRRYPPFFHGPVPRLPDFMHRHRTNIPRILIPGVNLPSHF